MKKYRIKSRSRPGLYQTVTDHATFWECTCEYWKFYQKCRHIETVKMRQGMKYEPIGGKCDWCDQVAGLQEHHLVRRSQGGYKHPTVFICHRCHRRATDNKEFEIHMQQTYGISQDQSTHGNIRRFGTDQEKQPELR